jgi:hypothetical protein
MLAVIAAVASLESGSLSNEAILFKNEAVLNQAKASDAWSYFQAKGIKEKIYSTQAEILGAANSGLVKKFTDESARYKTEQAELQKNAEELEKKVEENNERANRCMEFHHLFAISVTLFQVAIALSAIATLTRRQPLWWLGLGTGVIGLVYFVRGWMFFT